MDVVWGRKKEKEEGKIREQRLRNGLLRMRKKSVKRKKMLMEVFKVILKFK